MGDYTTFNFDKSEFAVAEDGIRGILQKRFNPQKIPWASDLNREGAQIARQIEQVQTKIDRLLSWIDFRNSGRGYDQLKFQIESFQKKATPVLRSVSTRLTNFDDSEAITALYYEFQKDFLFFEKRRKEIGSEITSAPKLNYPQYKDKNNPKNKDFNDKERKRFDDEKKAHKTYFSSRINELTRIKDKTRALQKKYPYADINKFLTKTDDLITKLNQRK